MTTAEKESAIAFEKKSIPNVSQLRTGKYDWYFEEYGQNLMYPMDKKHIDEYSTGSGGELYDRVNGSPAKMASMLSSSAMTFNLLGNGSIQSKPLNGHFACGEYAIEYEKQMYTLNMGSNPANLDAFLKPQKDSKHGIFCEMKMLEWLNSPGELKPAYYNADYYFDKTSFDVFRALIDKLKDKKEEDGSLCSRFSRYDAWQMFKHTLAIYNYTSSKTIGITINGKTEEIKSMHGEFEKITLANVVFELPCGCIASETDHQKYVKKLNDEKTQASEFISIMRDKGNGLADLFRSDCKVEFCIEYIPVPDFIDCFDKNPNELSYLRRYNCKN